MENIPIAGPNSEGRTVGTDWTIANVVRLLRSNAGRGAWEDAGGVVGSRAAANQYYVRKCSMKHLPTNLSLIFMQLAKPGRWYASLCFAGADGFLPWNAEAAEQWLCALFGEDRGRLEESAAHASVRQYTLKEGRR